jgi:small subunit ribosomal protein S6
MRNYEAMIVLDTKGAEQSVDQIVSTVSKEFEQAGAKLSQVDNLGRRKFPYSPRHVEYGYYINIHFQAEQSAITKVTDKLKLNSNVYQQYYQRQ